VSTGYIKLHRCIQDNPDWSAEPFTRSQAWIDMLLNASYKPHAVRIRGIKIDLSRGQLALSEVEYAKRWNWSRGKVHRFLKELESKTVQQITQQKTNITSVVTIINYDQYQGDDTASDTADGQQVVQQTGSRRAADGHIQEGIRRVEGKEGKELPPTVPTGTGKAKSFKQWTKEDFQESIIKANHDGIINKAECINFRDYWIEPSASGRMKFSLQKTWDTRLRIHNAIKMVYSKQRIETKQAANGSDYVVQTTQEDGR
jgi:hypothetical protein